MKYIPQKSGEQGFGKISWNWSPLTSTVQWPFRNKLQADDNDYEHNTQDKLVKKGDYSKGEY